MSMSVPEFSLSGKTAIVTGAGKGIGREIALTMARIGVDLFLTSRTEKDLIEVANQVEKLGRKVHYHVSDIRRVSEIQEMVRKARAAFSRMDILVNNAGVSFPQPAEEVTEKEWDITLDTNLKGLFFCAQAIGKWMIEQRQGKIVNIASQAGVVALPAHAAYCASKGGVILLTKVLAVEWACYGINVNCVAPTVIRTPMTDVVFADPEVRKEIIKKIPLGRIGEPEDVSGAVIFLSSKASDFITGETLLVDGGWAAQ
jgi:2-deoxy-D-gluconate 3-dehydrogenase